MWVAELHLFGDPVIEKESQGVHLSNDNYHCIDSSILKKTGATKKLEDALKFCDYLPVPNNC